MGDVRETRNGIYIMVVMWNHDSRPNCASWVATRFEVMEARFSVRPSQELEAHIAIDNTSDSLRRS